MSVARTAAFGQPTVRALVRRPGPRLFEGLVTHVERAEVDVELAMRQWSAYVRVLRDTGWKVVEVPPADEHPDAVFVEDTMVVVRQTAVIARPGAHSRRGEVVAAEGVARDLGLTIAHIDEPGTLDGGDVLKIARPDGSITMYVGESGRTNAAGIERLRSIVEPLDAHVVAVPMTKALHLKSAATALPDGTVIGYAPLLDDPAVFPSFLAMPEESGAHVVLLGGDRVLMSADAPASAELLRGLGYDPVLVDISEFVKLEGCVTCLSVRVR